LPRKLSQTVFEATNLPKKSEETSLPTKLLKQISNKKSLQRSFYQTNLEKHSQQKTQKTLYQILKRNLYSQISAEKSLTRNFLPNNLKKKPTSKI